MSINEYGLDADYFIKLCAREFSPEVIRSQRPADLARAFARAARTACAEVLDEREFASPAAEQPYSTTSDKYRAELYDEVWSQARLIGFGNVTDALAELQRMKLAEQPDTVKVPRELLAELRAFTLEYDSGRAGVMRGHIDALLGKEDA